MIATAFNISLKNWAVNFGIFSVVGLLTGLIQLISYNVFPDYLGAVVFLSFYFLNCKNNSREIPGIFLGEMTVAVLSIIIYILLPGTSHDSPDSAAVLSFVFDLNPSIEKFSYFSTIWGPANYLLAVGYGSELFVVIWRFVQLYTIIYWLLVCLSIVMKRPNLRSLFGSVLFLTYIFSPMFLRHIYSFQTNIASAQTLMAVLVLVNAEKAYLNENILFQSILLGSLLVMFSFMRIDSLILIIPLMVYILIIRKWDKFMLVTFLLLSVVIVTLFAVGQYNIGGLTNIFNKNIFYILMSIGPLLSLALLVGGNYLYLYLKENIERLLSLENKILYWLLFGCVILVLLSLNLARFDGLYNFLYNTFSYKSIRRSWGFFYYGIVLSAVLGVFYKRLISIDILLALSLFILTLVLAGGRRIGEGDSLNRMMLTVGVAFVYPYLKQHKLC